MNKLYVWEDSQVDHTAGVMFALGESVEKAREAIRAAELRLYGRVSRGTEEDLKQKPDVYRADRKSPIGFVVAGGG